MYIQENLKLRIVIQFCKLNSNNISSNKEKLRIINIKICTFLRIQMGRCVSETKFFGFSKWDCILIIPITVRDCIKIYENILHGCR